MIRNTRVVVEGSKIVAVDPKAAQVVIDLRGLTVMPGWIDAHVHLGWHSSANSPGAEALGAASSTATTSAAAGREVSP